MSEPAQTGYVFLPYQQDWAADDSPVKVCEKSRRIGLTWSESGDDTLYAGSESGDDVWYIGYNKDMAEEFITECGSWAKKFKFACDAVEEEIIKDEDKDILTFKIKFASGNKIVALSSRPSNLRGKQGRVVIDEAAFHDDLGELIKAAMALLMWGGEVRIISTHNGADNPFNLLIEDIRAGKKPYSLHRITFDDAVSQGLFKRICLVKKQEWRQEKEDKWVKDMRDFYGDDSAEELDVIPAKGGGIFLSRVLIESCMSDVIPVIRYGKDDEFNKAPDEYRYSEIAAWCEDVLKPLLAGLDPKRQTVFGEDFARNGDLTVMVPAQETQGGDWHSVFVLELSNLAFKQQEQICFYIIDRLPKFHHGSFDSRGNGQYLAEVAMQKYTEKKISQVMISTAWYRDIMPKYKAMFEDRSILLPKDADIIEDHRAFKMNNGVAMLPGSRTSGENNLKRHGDSGIAGAMVCHAIEQEGGDNWDFMPETATMPVSNTVRGY